MELELEMEKKHNLSNMSVKWFGHRIVSFNKFFIFHQILEVNLLENCP